MKKQLLFLAMLFSISTLFSQGYSKGDWQFGPVLSFGTNMDITKFENIALTGNAGLFANYALSDVTLGIIEAKYEFRTDFENHFQYINIPALICFQFNNQYLGFGAQYSYCVSPAKDYFKIPDGTLHYPSAIIEYSYIAHSISNGHTVTYIPEGFRAIVRVGYALTKISYGLVPSTFSGGIYKYSPFFLETTFRFDIGKYFSKNTHKAKRRRR